MYTHVYTQTYTQIHYGEDTKGKDCVNLYMKSILIYNVSIQTIA